MFDVKNRLKLRQVREVEALLMQLRNFNYEELTEWAANYTGEHLKVKELCPKVGDGLIRRRFELA